MTAVLRKCLFHLPIVLHPGVEHFTIGHLISGGRGGDSGFLLFDAFGSFRLRGESFCFLPFLPFLPSADPVRVLPPELDAAPEPGTASGAGRSSSGAVPGPTKTHPLYGGPLNGGTITGSLIGP